MSVYCTCNDESPSNQQLHAVVICSAADASKAGSLIISELTSRRIDVIRADAESSAHLDAVLRRCRRRCVVYLSPRSVSSLDQSSLLRRDRDAVVVVVDDTLDRPPDEWAHFLCLRYENLKLDELCRELKLLIGTPPLPRRPEDITGYAAAHRDHNGYYRLILPNFRQRLQQLPTDYHASCVKKLLIVCPESCRCATSMDNVGSIEHAGVYVLKNVTRAGQKHRDYSATVYRMRDEERNGYSYFAAEFAHSLATFSNIVTSQLAGIDDARMCRERIHYILHKQQLLQHSRNINEQCRIVYWRDEVKPELRLDKVLLPVVSEELESQPVEDVPMSPTDCQHVDGPGVNPGSLHVDPAKCYKLERDPKGMCLIINIAAFESSTTADNTAAPPPPTRIGSEADVRQLEEVFRWLKFNVKVRSNVGKEDFLRIVNETRELDHSAYDAFVCCIMSHGYLGHIWTADGQAVRILDDVAQAFYPESCPTLVGKPKIFFIQSCQISDVHYSSTGRPDTADETEFLAAEAVECDAEPCGALDVGKRTLLLPDAPDFFMSYSTLPRHLSYRVEEGETGTFYVQALTDVLKKGLELQASLCEVIRRVEQKAAEKGVEGRQRPFHYVSVDHKSVFLCGKHVRFSRHIR